MADTAPTPSEYPLHSMEYFWDRIIDCSLTEDDTTAMWRYIISAARAAQADSVDDADTCWTLVDFKEAVLDINKRGDAHERAVLMSLVQGATDTAATRCEAIVAQAAGLLSEKLWFKGALFAPTSPLIAREAWQRLLQLRPDFHYARCALGQVLERLGDLSGAEAAYQTVVTNAGADKGMQARAVDFLGTMAIGRRDFDGATHFLERSLELYRDLDDAHAVYLTLKQLAAVAEAREELLLTESYLRQALEVAGQRADANDVLSTLSLISATAEARGDCAAAEDAVRRAIGLHEHRNDKHATAAGYARLGDLALLRDDLSTAFKQHDHGRAISQECGDDAGTARAFGALGVIRVREKEYGDADWYFKNAAVLYDKVGDQHMNALMLEKLGWVSHLRGDTDAARGQLQDALTQYTNAGMHEAARKLRQDMTEVGIG